jgi:hypothetical protein
LDLPLDEVPNFSEFGPGKAWFDPAMDWLEEQGYGFLYFHPEDSVCAIGVYGLGFFSVVGTEERHSVVLKFLSEEGPDPNKVYWKADIAHDPNPNQNYTLDCIQEYLIPVKLT